jgi:hypothetical protein
MKKAAGAVLAVAMGMTCIPTPLAVYAQEPEEYTVILDENFESELSAGVKLSGGVSVVEMDGNHVLEFNDTSDSETSKANIEIGKQAGEGDHAFHVVALNQLLADFTFVVGVAAHRAIGQQERHAASGGQVVKHVLQPGKVGVALRWGAIAQPARVVVQLGAPPLFHIEWWIGHHVVGAQVGVQVVQQGVARLAAKVEVQPTDDHIHGRQFPGGGVAFLAVDADLLGAFFAVGVLLGVALDEFFALYKKPARAHGGVVHPDLKSKDILGHVYEYFLGQFALAEGKKGGQYYTPKSIVTLIVEMLQPFKGRVYDPAMGSGGFFVQSEEFIQSHTQQHADRKERAQQISIYGQESNPTTWKLAAMNMVIRGLDFNFGGQPGDTLLNDLHPDLRADYVMANPPFNMKEWWSAKLDNDPRWLSNCTPPQSNANFAWLQHMLYHLAPTGSMALLLANGSMSSNTNNEGEIRKQLIECDYVECMVALPGLFTDFNVCLTGFAVAGIIEFQHVVSIHLDHGNPTAQLDPGAQFGFKILIQNNRVLLRLLGIHRQGRGNAGHSHSHGQYRTRGLFHFRIQVHRHSSFVILF